MSARQIGGWRGCGDGAGVGAAQLNDSGEEHAFVDPRVVVEAGDAVDGKQAGPIQVGGDGHDFACRR